MKKIFFPIVLITAFTSCTMVEFEQPQPNNIEALTEFPESFRGSYIIKLLDKESSSASEDTFQISTNYYSEKGGDGKDYLSDSIVLKKSKYGYFISTISEDDDHWTVCLIEQKPNKDIILLGLYDNQDDKEAFFSAVKKIVPIKEVNKGEDGATDYVIDPTPKQLKTITKKKLFKPAYEFIRISD